MEKIEKKKKEATIKALRGDKGYIYDEESQSGYENKLATDVIKPIDRFNNEEIVARYSNSYIASQFEMQSSQAKNKKDQDRLRKTAMQFRRKEYSFTFKNHNYTYGDSARVQSKCPHCENSSSNGYCWSVEDEAFIGAYKLNEYQMALCFECPLCHEKFFYHQTVDFWNDQIELGRVKG